MNNKDDIMRFENVLPIDFDGTFRFTNPSDEDFVGVWGKKEYLFPAKTTTPMLIVEHSPVEIQHIRKKFAKDLAEREFYRSKGYKTLRDQEGKPGNRTMNSIHQAAAYTLSDLAPYIQKCLVPLTPSTLKVKPMNSVPLESVLSRNDDGELNTQVVDEKTSLRKKALEA